MSDLLFKCAFCKHATTTPAVAKTVFKNDGRDHFKCDCPRCGKLIRFVPFSELKKDQIKAWKGGAA